MKIYVGNLSFDANEKDIQDAFAAFGKVETVNIIKDSFSGKSRGFGFVEMPTDSEASTAITELNGKDLKGRPLKVNEAHAKTDGGRPRRPGGGGGRDNRGGGGRSSFKGGRGNSYY